MLSKSYGAPEGLQPQNTKLADKSHGLDRKKKKSSLTWEWSESGRFELEVMDLRE